MKVLHHQQWYSLQCGLCAGRSVGGRESDYQRNGRR